MTPTPICLLHIPKTSGTSLYLYLETQYHPSDICPARTDREYRELDRADLARYRFFRTEVNASITSWLPPGTHMVTFLREPLSRARSHWRFIQRLPRHRLQREFSGERATLECFLDAMPANFVANLLAVEDDADREWMWDTRGVWSEQDLLDRALARLESFSFVGITERYEESVAHLAHRFGWAPPRHLPRANAAPPTDEAAHATPAQRRRFMERNAVDVELYRRAGELFDRRARLSSPEVRSQVYEQRVATSSQVLDDRLDIDMAAPPRGTGWLPAMTTDAGVMRPIGLRGEASLDLAVRLPRFARIEIHCPGFESLDALLGLEVAVNGERLSLQLQPEATGVTLHGSVPPSGEGRHDFTRIEIRATRTAPAPEGAVSDIDYSVGIARISLVPCHTRRPGRLPAPC